MVITDNSESKLYCCASAGWRSVVVARDTTEAAKLGLKQAMDELGTSCEVSACLLVREIINEFQDNDEIVRTDSTLADLGLHEKAKALGEILKEY